MAYIMIFCGFMGFLMAASGTNLETGSTKANLIVGFISAAVMLIGLIKMKQEERKHE